MRLGWVAKHEFCRNAEEENVSILCGVSPSVSRTGSVTGMPPQGPTPEWHQLGEKFSLVCRGHYWLAGVVRTVLSDSPSRSTGQFGKWKRTKYETKQTAKRQLIPCDSAEHLEDVQGKWRSNSMPQVLAACWREELPDTQQHAEWLQSRCG
jgi:hypothetical protein